MEKTEDGSACLKSECELLRAACDVTAGIAIGQTQDSGLSTHKSPIFCFNPAKTIRN